MKLYYRKKISHDFQFMDNSLIEIDIRHRHPYSPTEFSRLIGPFPCIVSRLRVIGICLPQRSVSECQYMVYLSALNTSNTYSSIKLPNRLVFLIMPSNFIRSTTNSHSYVRHKKDKVSVRLPNSLLLLDIHDNSVFRVVPGTRLTEIACDLCENMNEMRVKEGTICVSQFVTHHRKPKTKQKSIRFYKLNYWGDDSNFKTTIFGSKGVYNVFLYLTDYNAILIKRKSNYTHRLN